MKAFRTYLIFFTCIAVTTHAQQNVTRCNGPLQPALALPSVNTFNIPVQTTTYPQCLSPAFYTQHLSFFCRQELKMEHSLRTPLKIRVGSIDACNYLEQKPGYKFWNK